MTALLALYLSADRVGGGFGWSTSAALTLSGLFNGLMYALPVLGGWIADRFLGYRRALTAGGTLLLIGYIVLTGAVSGAHTGGGSHPPPQITGWLPATYCASRSASRTAPPSTSSWPEAFSITCPTGPPSCCCVSFIATFCPLAAHCYSPIWPKAIPGGC